MARRKLNEILEYVRQSLKDEFLTGVGYTWGDDELQLIADQVVMEVSTFSPRIVKETLTTTASREIDVSTLYDLIGVDEVEYPVGATPAKFVNFNLKGDTLVLLMPSVPSAGQSIVIWAKETHQLTPTASSLRPQEEVLVMRGIIAIAAINKARELINQVNLGGAGAAQELENWGLRRLAEYKTDLIRNLNNEAPMTKYHSQ
jgi:hypothetical protein